MAMQRTEESGEKKFDHRQHIINMKNILLFLVICALAYLYLFVIE